MSPIFVLFPIPLLFLCNVHGAGKNNTTYHIYTYIYKCDTIASNPAAVHKKETGSVDRSCIHAAELSLLHMCLCIICAGRLLLQLLPKEPFSRPLETHHVPRDYIGLVPRMGIDAEAVGRRLRVSHGHVDRLVTNAGGSHEPAHCSVEHDRVALLVQAVVPCCCGYAWRERKREKENEAAKLVKLVVGGDFGFMDRSIAIID